MRDKEYKTCMPFFGVENRMGYQADDVEIMDEKTFWNFIDNSISWGSRYFDDKKTMADIIQKKEDLDWFVLNHNNFYRRLSFEVADINSLPPINDYFAQHTLKTRIMCIKHCIMFGKTFVNELREDKYIKNMDLVCAPNPQVPVFALDFEKIYRDWLKVIDNDEPLDILELAD
jgi:hypothetical protein